MISLKDYKEKRRDKILEKLKELNGVDRNLRRIIDETKDPIRSNVPSDELDMYQLQMKFIRTKAIFLRASTLGNNSSPYAKGIRNTIKEAQEKRNCINFHYLLTYDPHRERDLIRFYNSYIKGNKREAS